jgi:hypothetical protein
MMRQHVKILKKVEAFDISGTKFGPFEASDEVDVWSWEANVLERHGLAERQRITPTQVRQLIISEERNSVLENLPENFYFSVRDEISALHKSNDGAKAQELKSHVSALLETRLTKLLKLVPSPEESANIPPEERFLVNRLAAVFKAWSKNLEGFLGTQEEADKGDITGVV